MKKNNTYKFNYSFYDANINFVNILLWPLVASLVYIILLAFLSALASVPLEEFMEFKFVEYLTAFLTPVVFLSVFFMYNKKHNINYVIASKIQKKLEPFKVTITILICFSSIYLFAPFINLVDYLISLLGFELVSEFPIAMNSNLELICAIIALAVMPAIAEELMLRGIIFNGLRSKLGDYQAVLISALMFMLMHGSIQQTVYQFMLGVILGFVMLYTNNILYPMILHFLNNFIAIISAYAFIKSGAQSNEITFNGAIDYIIPFVYLLIGFVVIYILINALKNNSFKNAFTLPKNKKEKADKNTNIILVNDPNSMQTSILIEVNDKPKTFKNLTKHEKRLLFLSLGFGILLWLINTIDMLL